MNIENKKTLSANNSSALNKRDMSLSYDDMDVVLYGTCDKLNVSIARPDGSSSQHYLSMVVDKVSGEIIDSYNCPHPLSNIELLEYVTEVARRVVGTTDANVAVLTNVPMLMENRELGQHLDDIGVRVFYKALPAEPDFGRL